MLSDVICNLTWIMNNMALCLKLLQRNLGVLGKDEKVPILVTHRDERAKVSRVSK